MIVEKSKKVGERLDFLMHFWKNPLSAIDSCDIKSFKVRLLYGTLQKS
jgi:hypothetical protein